MKKHIFPIFTPSTDDSTCIYHYTNLEGATGILSEKKLWMTNIRYLNDRMEGRYFYEPLLEMIGEDSEHIDKLNQLYETCLKNTYIASFSRTPDLLSQYKYYGNICMAFDQLGIDDCRRELNNNPTSGFESPSKVDYSSSEKYAKVITDLAADKNLIKGVVNEDIYSLLRFFCFIGLIKHPGFFEENETRFFHFWYRHKDVRYRFSDGRRVPYLEFKLFPSVIKRIIVGPSRIQKEIAIDIKESLESNEDLHHIDICCSEIPFIPAIS